jgi:RNA polymerase sigma factor (sigma-70 family)
MKTNLISKEEFDLFLARLDADREKAGLEYERVRGRLLFYFQCRNIAQAEDCADEAINRAIIRLSAGEEILDPVKYVFGVARIVLLEVTRQQMRREEIADDTLVTNPQDEDDEELQIRLNCLRRCLQKLPSEQRELITQYYEEEKRAKIELRQQMAQRFGIDLNALRVRASRVRDGLKSCVRKCAAG